MIIYNYIGRYRPVFEDIKDIFRKHGHKTIKDSYFRLMGDRGIIQDAITILDSENINGSLQNDDSLEDDLEEIKVLISEKKKLKSPRTGIVRWKISFGWDNPNWADPNYDPNIELYHPKHESINPCDTVKNSYLNKLEERKKFKADIKNFLNQ